MKIHHRLDLVFAFFVLINGQSMCTAEEINEDDFSQLETASRYTDGVRKRVDLVPFVDASIRFVSCNDVAFHRDNSEHCLEVKISNNTNQPLCLSIGDFEDSPYTSKELSFSRRRTPYNIQIKDLVSDKYVQPKENFYDHELIGFVGQPRLFSGLGTFNIVPPDLLTEFQYSLNYWWPLSGDREYRVVMYGDAFLCGTIGTGPAEYVPLFMQVE